MVKSATTIAFVVLALGGLCSTNAVKAATSDYPPATNLKVDRLASKHAISIGRVKPTFSWIVPLIATQPGVRQVAYRLVVNNANENEDTVVIWDSGKVNSNRSHLVAYGGPALKAFGSYSFTVMWFASSTDESSQASAPCHFGIGPLSETDWHGAKWVGQGDLGSLRATIENSPVGDDHFVRARAFIAAPGCFVLSVNNQSVGPSNGICKWEHFTKHRAYITVDIPINLLSPGSQNHIDILLGHGMWTRYGNHRPPTVLGLLLLETASGERLFIPSSSSAASIWSHTANTYIIRDDPFKGAEMNWSHTDVWLPGLPEATQSTATANFVVYPMDIAPTIDQKALLPQTVSFLSQEYGGAVFIYDMGENIVGTCEVYASGKGIVHLRHGEMLLPNGSLNLNYSGQATGVKADFQHDTHHIDSDDIRTGYRPTFTWYGFQYVSVYVESPSTIYFNGSSLQHSITCYQMYPDFDHSQFGSVHFDDDKYSSGVAGRLNSVQAITRASQLGNIVQYAPTDCPTREKHFWLGDALDTVVEAMYNLGPDSATLYSNFLQIVEDEQSARTNDIPGVVPSLSPENEKWGSQISDISWTAAYPIICAGLYSHFGDDLIMRQHYASMDRFMENLYNMSASPDKLPSFFKWGDWCSAQSRAVATPATGPPAAAANWILSTDAMRDMSAVIGQPKSVQEMWDQRGKKGRSEWHAAFYNKQEKAYGYKYGDNDFILQTLTSLPLAMGGTVPDASLGDVVQTFAHDFVHRGYHLTYGSVGQKYVYDQLSAHGNHTVAMRTVTQTTFPSYGHWIANGATTCWENWSGVADAQHPPQPTHNHIFLCGGVGEWMYKHVVGITAAGPGFERVRIRPLISMAPLDGPAKATGTVGTNYGQVKVAWSRNVEENTVTVMVVTPKPARVELPTIGKQPSDVTVTGTIGNSSTQVSLWVHGSFEKDAVTGVVSGEGETGHPDGTKRIILQVLRGSYTFTVIV